MLVGVSFIMQVGGIVVVIDHTFRAAVLVVLKQTVHHSH